MQKIEIMVNPEKDSIINYDYRNYKIGNPEKVSLSKSLNKGKMDIILMYKGPFIPEQVRNKLSQFAEDVGLIPEIISRESVYLPNYRDMWCAEMPGDIEVNINYKSIK
jgi:hypothetical protein